jgi:hypothetical protein
MKKLHALLAFSQRDNINKSFSRSPSFEGYWDQDLSMDVMGNG